VHDRANLDGEVAGGRIAGDDLRRAFQVLALEQVEAGQVLLALGERPVGDCRDAVPHAHRLRVRRMREHDGSAEQLARLDQPREEDVGVAVVEVALLLREARPGGRIVVDQRDELHASLLSVDRAVASESEPTTRSRHRAGRG
jgi:hypothetical protein